MSAGKEVKWVMRNAVPSLVLVRAICVLLMSLLVSPAALAEQPAGSPEADAAALNQEMLKYDFTPEQRAEVDARVQSSLAQARAYLAGGDSQAALREAGWVARRWFGTTYGLTAGSICVQALLASGDFEGAKHRALKLLAEAQLVPGAEDVVAETQATMAEIDKAAAQCAEEVRAWQAVIDRNPDGALAPLAGRSLGDVYLRYGNALAALSAYKKAAATYPGTEDAGYAIARMVEICRRPWVEALQEAWPTVILVADMLAGQAMDLMEAGEYAAAIAKFREEINVYNGAPAHYWIARCYDALGHTEEARAEGQFIAEHYPGDLLAEEGFEWPGGEPLCP
jgi:tetratricopeptide (TPR) repeat protein